MNSKGINKFSLPFSIESGDIILRAGDGAVSMRALYDDICRRYSDRFRGAFVYSKSQLIENVRETSHILSKYFDEYKICWAVKSAPMAAIVDVMVREGVGFDVGSSEELALAINAGARGEDVYHTAAGKYGWDIDAIVKSGAVSISDNLVELKLLDGMASSAGVRLKVGIRINPAIESKTQAAISTASSDCKFGMPAVSPEFLRELGKLSNLRVSILHMHIGSQIADPENYGEALKKVIDVFGLFRAAGFEIEGIDVGGGFPFRYSDEKGNKIAGGEHSFENNPSSDFEDYIRKISYALKKGIGDELPQVSIEPGRHLVAGTAFVLGYVLNTKDYPDGTRWVISSVNVNDLWHKSIAPSMRFDIRAMQRNAGSRLVKSHVGGTLCYSGDVLTPYGEAVLLPGNLERGDILIINNVGAYSLLGSGSFHNMPRLPILMMDEKFNLIEIKKPD